MLRGADLQAANVGLLPEGLTALRAKLIARLDKGRAEELLRRVRLTFDRDAGQPFFVTVAFEYAGDASLSWYLTETEKQNILTAADSLDGRINLLKQWWLAPAAQDGKVGK